MADDTESGKLSHEARQESFDEDYGQVYEDWMASLSPEDRRRAKELGVDQADLANSATGSAEGDLAESALARCGPEDPALMIEHDSPTENADTELLHDMLRRMVGELIGKDNARLSLECLALVTGLCYSGDSMADIARRHGITRAAVSKRCIELTTALNLKPSRAMRSLQIREHHRVARLNHLQEESP